MKRIGLAALILASGCWNGSLGDWDVGGSDLHVCVQGDAGRCCTLLPDLCSAVDEGCLVGGPALRPPERCLRCAPWEIDDGGMLEREFFAPPPNPPSDAAFFWRDADGGVHDNRVEVCGPATYRRYD